MPQNRLRILITRPVEDAAQIAVVLAARGHEGVIAPLLTVRFRDGAELALDGVQAILATSANGVRALARRNRRRDVALFAVGPQTADEAQAAGFQTVKNAQGDARALAAAAVRWAAPADGPLLHVKGAEGDGLLATLLRGQGFDVRSVALYDVVAAEALPPAARDRLARGALDAALFFSPRSARVFRDCIEAAGLPVDGLIAICISDATAAALAPLVFREIRIASRPNQEALLACLC